jgi:hypothetical protein
LADKVAVKNCIAAIVYGEEPAKVSQGVGAFFGMSGGKEGQIASEGQERIYTPKPVERTTEEQRDMAERRKVPQDDKNPFTSDRAIRKPAVSAPLKEKTDSAFRAILVRHEKHQQNLAKNAARNKRAEALYPDYDTKTMTKKDLTEFTVLDGCSKTDCIHHQEGGEFDCKRPSISIAYDGSCLFYEKGTGVVADLEKYTNRIKKGECPTKVMHDLLASVSKQAVGLAPGDTVKVNKPNGQGETQITIDSVGKTPDNSMAVTGKDPSGNIMAGEVMLVPAQPGAMTGPTNQVA